jgi:hypothetical protein
VLAKDRPVTDQERPQLEAALRAAGCGGGKMESYRCEVDASICQEEKK